MTCRGSQGYLFSEVLLGLAAWRLKLRIPTRSSSPPHATWKPDINTIASEGLQIACLHLLTDISPYRWFALPCYSARSARGVHSR